MHFALTYLFELYMEMFLFLFFTVDTETFSVSVLKQKKLAEEK